MGQGTGQATPLHVVTIVLPDGTRKQAEFDYQPMDTIRIPTFDGFAYDAEGFSTMRTGAIDVKRTDERDEFGFIIYR